ncbi:hypothetical protein CW354_19345 [Marinicaulis flavus]|uniref:Nucleotidyltransferase family protein n=2 Tax=Hyphococcus luteus TaxID=2058213 RepID=A0A2S7K1V3_9PROT|nr:hypothetical protein CW354_19345 [Marinicaulis flavus]
MNSDLIELLAAFEKNSVRYLIIGGYAVGFHAEPRYTKDCDFWIATDPKNAEAIFKTLKEFGAPLYGCTPEDFQGSDEFFFFGESPNRIDIIMGPPGNVDFEKAWSRRIEREVDGTVVSFASREDLIRLKEASGREIDKRDVEALKKSKG